MGVQRAGSLHRPESPAGKLRACSHARMNVRSLTLRASLYCCRACARGERLVIYNIAGSVRALATTHLQKAVVLLAAPRGDCLRRRLCGRHRDRFQRCGRRGRHDRRLVRHLVFPSHDMGWTAGATCSACPNLTVWWMIEFFQIKSSRRDSSYSVTTTARLAVTGAGNLQYVL